MQKLICAVDQSQSYKCDEDLADDSYGEVAPQWELNIRL